MPYFVHGDTRLHHRIAGEGPLVVLLHGLGSSGADWAFQEAALADHFSLLMPDFRGSGLSDKPGSRRVDGRLCATSRALGCS